MYKLGLNYYSGFGIPCEDWMKTVKELGFDAVFSGFTAKSADKLLSMGEFAELAAKNGLVYDCIHAPFDTINDIWSTADCGDVMLNRLTDCIEGCGKYGVPTVVVHLSSGTKPPHINDAGRLRFDKLIDCAVKNNVTVAFENQRKFGNLSFVMELYEDVKNVGFCWDVGHEKCFASGKEFMPIFGDRLVYTHIHDNYCLPNGDFHMIPFDGKIDYSRTAELIKKYPCSNGTLTLEVFPIPGNQIYYLYEGLTACEYYAKAYNAASKLRQLVEN